MLQKSGRLVLWEAMFILELHSAETQETFYILIFGFSLNFLSSLQKFFLPRLFIGCIGSFGNTG